MSAAAERCCSVGHLRRAFHRGEHDDLRPWTPDTEGVPSRGVNMMGLAAVFVASTAVQLVAMTMALLRIGDALNRISKTIEEKHHG